MKISKMETPKVTPPTKEHQATMHQVHQNQPKLSSLAMWENAIQHYHGRKMSREELEEAHDRLNPDLPNPYRQMD